MSALFDYLLPQDIALLQGFWSPQATLVKPQAEDLARLQIMASRLGPEQQTIVAEGHISGIIIWLCLTCTRKEITRIGRVIR